MIKPGTFTSQPGHLIDFMATFADVGEATYPSEFSGQKITPLEGKSLRPIFDGEQREPHETLCWEWSGNRAIRQGKWKAVWDSLVKKWDLYDLQVDRTETNNLASNDPERTQALADEWTAWAKRTTVIKK